jgi:pimeloyl-ACP methyl ester carboxylesterase
MTIRCETFELTVTGPEAPRMLAGRDCGLASAPDVLVCLPGLLETQASFDPLVQCLGDRFRLFTMDFAGRGLSSPMADAQHYKMSSYLADLGLFMAHIQGRLSASQASSLHMNLFGKPRAVQAHRRHLLGTSMGGLLAMFLAKDQPNQFSSLILNDVACLLPWTGIMGLMSGLGSATKGHSLFGNLNELAQTLRVDPALIRAVQKPAHLDLPHRNTMFGVDFTEVFEKLDHPILLLKAGQSGIIDDQALAKMKACHRDLQVFEVPDAEHPVPYSPAACERISQFLRGPAPGQPSNP